jgi:Domain of unknown function (DUF4375)
MRRTDRFINYSGETAEELLSYPAKNQWDALARAFEQGIQQKSARKGEGLLTEEEWVVLAVRALDREVNNGGYDQFLRNSAKRFAPIIVTSLKRIGCKRTAQITQDALNTLEFGTLDVKSIDKAMAEMNEKRDQRLNQCDQRFYSAPQGISRRLYAFIKAHQSHINF